MITSDQAYKILERIGAESSTLGKVELMKENPGLAPFFMYAYNPYWRFHIAKVDLTPPDQGVFTQATWRMLDMMRKRQITGNSAKGMLKHQLSLLTGASQYLLRNIITKDLRCGVDVKLINRAFPSLIPEFGVMLAEEYDPDRVSFPIYGSPKIDGLRGIYSDGVFYSRKGHPFESLTTIGEKFKAALPEFAKLDGELTVPGQSFQKSSGFIRGDRRLKKVTYSVFDAPEDETATFEERLILLQEYARIINREYPEDQFVRMVPHTALHDDVEVGAFYLQCRGADYEGTVLKTMGHLYQNKRSYDWMKMKDVLTSDVRVTQVLPGKGKYARMMGSALAVDDQGRPAKVGGGWSDQQRLLYYHHPERLVGAFIEIQYQQKTDGDNYRHARFVRRRDDK